MPPIQVTKPQLRDLILDFYSTYDPERLRIGIDINGMVDWTFANGIEQLNSMLQQTYGNAIDLNKRLGSVDLFKRASTALVDMSLVEAEENKRNEIYIKLYKFYEMHDRTKLPGIQKIVDFAMYQGVEALNDKLYLKYNEDLGNEWSFQDVDSRTMRVYKNDNGGPPQQQQQQQGMMQNNYNQGQNFQEMNVNEEYYESDDNNRVASFANYSEENVEEMPPPMNLRNSNGRGMRKDPVTQFKQANDLSYQNKRPVTNSSQLPPPPLEDLDEDFEEVEDFLPPAPPIEDFIDPQKIIPKLKEFYSFYDPSKLDVLEAIADWAGRIGRIEFNSKLLQLYGATLDDPLPSKQPVKDEPVLMYQTSFKAPEKPVEQSVTASPKKKPPPPKHAPPKRLSMPKMQQPEQISEQPVGNFEAELRSHSSKNVARKDNPMFQPPEEVVDVRSFKSPPNPYNKKEEPKKKPGPPPGLPKNSYNTGSADNVETQSPSKRPKPQSPPPFLKQNQSFSEEQGNVVEEENVDMNQQMSHDMDKLTVNDINRVACDNYRLDMTGKSYGDCVCGMPRAAHKNKANKAKVAQISGQAQAVVQQVNMMSPKPTKPKAMIKKPAAENQNGGSSMMVPMKPVQQFQAQSNVFDNKQAISPKLVNAQASKSKACDNYRLDMTGATFGVCVCGFPRVDHPRR